jgi:glycerol-3-phosphate dehydrogenase (NAD(P)+)
VAVIGAGSWGTALAHAIAHQGYEVALWAYEREVAENIRELNENTLYFPGTQLHRSIVATTDFHEALNGAAYVYTVMPSHVCRAVFEGMLPFLKQEMILVSATKGLEQGTLMRMSQVILSVVEKRFSPRLTVLSGPSFAREVAASRPTAIVVAAEEPGLAERVQWSFSSRAMRLYTSADIAGVEIGGAVKNVIAIAAGVIEGLELGHNPMAALITRGLAEMSRLGCACGGRYETLAGLAGLGDLVLTCTGSLSRNRSLGIELGKGGKLRDIVKSKNSVAEGINTTGAALRLAERVEVDMPITRQVYRILQGSLSPHEAIQELMDRSLKEE